MERDGERVNYPAQRETRNHRTLVEGDIIEFVGDLPGSVREAVACLWAEAEETDNAILMDWLRKYLRIGPSINGKRATQIVDALRAERERPPNLAMTLSPDYRPGEGQANGVTGQVQVPKRKRWGLG